MERLRREDPEQIGPWTIVGRLGSGGMGEVFIGKQGTKLAAVKVLHAWYATDPNFKSRFIREIESISNLKSPFIANYIGSDVGPNVGWLATEYIEGPSLREEIEVNGPLDDIAWQKLATGLLSAIEEMGKFNVVHRDIKPSNIILSSKGPKLIDFGLAQQVDSTSLTTTGLIAGSPAWLSPESINGEPLTRASDLFSLGSVLAYAKSGKSAWGDGPTAVVFHNIVTRKHKLEGLNPEQEKLVSQLLDKDPKKRINLILKDSKPVEESYSSEVNSSIKQSQKFEPSLLFQIIEKFRKKLLQKKLIVIAFIFSCLLSLNMNFESLNPYQLTENATDKPNLRKTENSNLAYSSELKTLEVNYCEKSIEAAQLVDLFERSARISDVKKVYDEFIGLKLKASSENFAINSKYFDNFYTWFDVGPYYSDLSVQPETVLDFCGEL